MGAAERKTVSERMRRYWEASREPKPKDATWLCGLYRSHKTRILTDARLLPDLLPAFGGPLTRSCSAATVLALASNFSGPWFSVVDLDLNAKLTSLRGGCLVGVSRRWHSSHWSILPWLSSRLVVKTGPRLTSCARVRAISSSNIFASLRQFS